MPRGGSQPGERRGGRQKGTPNKATAAREAAIRASGLTPLEYMLKIMRDRRAEPARRDWAAGAAAPYIHSRLQAIELETPPAEVNVKIDLLILARQMALALMLGDRALKAKLIDASQSSKGNGSGRIGGGCSGEPLPERAPASGEMLKR